MTKKIVNINKDVIKNVKDEIQKTEDKRIRDIAKNFYKEQLQLKESLKQKKNKIDDELRIVNKNISDLENGNFDMIQDRIDNSEMAYTLFPNFASLFSSDSWSPSYIRGVYKIKYIDSWGNNINKTIIK